MRPTGMSWERQKCQQGGWRQWASRLLSVRLLDLPLEVLPAYHPFLLCEPHPHGRAHCSKHLPVGLGRLACPHTRGTFSGLRCPGVI